MASETIRSDVMIAGGGMVGLTLAVGLARQGLTVAVADALDPAKASADEFDGRCSAIAHASKQMLDAIGVWDRLLPHAQPIDQIRVSDRDSLLHLHFDHREVGDEPLGFMVENRFIRRGLFEEVATMDNIVHRAPDAIVGHRQDGFGAGLDLESGARIQAPLLIAADGRSSPIRAREGLRVTRKRYPVHAIVAAVAHELPHCGIAHERFQQAGPFAILPMVDNRSSLVWTVDADIAEAMMALPRRAFDAEIRARIGDFLGAVEILAPRWCYPLGLHYAERYVSGRIALIGDAGHGIHPIAGQGLNMGFRDIAAMVEILTEAARHGLDLGSAPILERYQRWRRTDNLVLAAVTDRLNALFASENPLVRRARDVGLAAVHRLPPARRFFMQHARGSFGTDIPKLLRGEPL